MPGATLDVLRCDSLAPVGDGLIPHLPCIFCACSPRPHCAVRQPDMDPIFMGRRRQGDRITEGDEWQVISQGGARRAPPRVVLVSATMAAWPALPDHLEGTVVEHHGCHVPAHVQVRRVPPRRPAEVHVRVVEVARSRTVPVAIVAILITPTPHPPVLLDPAIN